MTTTTALAVDHDWSDHEAVADAIGVPFNDWAHQCHGISHAIVMALPPGAARVARGSARGVGSQHSWVVLGGDCYDPNATIIDPTLWSYRDDIDGIHVTTLGAGDHYLMGQTGTLFGWGCPIPGDDDVVELTPTEPWSGEAKIYLRLWARTVGGDVNADPPVPAFDRRAWSTLIHEAPVHGWPIGEFVAAIADTPAVAAIVPVDVLGMLTDRNPGGMYLNTGES